MSITSDQKSQVIDLIRRKYPEWVNFEYRPFMRDEINTKRLTVKKANALLSESTLAHMLVTRDTDAFIDRLERLGKATNLLDRPGTEHGDMEILYVPTLDKPVFCAQIYHLLHGTESAQERLAAYLRYVEDHELPNSWTFPTYLLFFSNPRTEFFVEPQPTEWFLKYIGLSPYLGKPSPDTYTAIKEFAHGLKHALAEYKPHDMIDIQSLIRVCATMSQQAKPAGVGVAPPPQPVEFWTEEEAEDADATVLHPSNPLAQQEPAKPAPAQAPAPAARTDRPSTPLDQHYRVFLESFMTAPPGIAAAVAFAKAREQAEQHFAHIVAEHELGEIVTERVFLHLLPHVDRKEHVSSGAWIHPMPAMDDALNALAQLSSQEREQAATALLELTRQCVYNPRGITAYIDRFKQNVHAAPFQSRHVSPMLHALKPGAFTIATDDAVATINFFSGTNYTSQIDHYPEVNEAGLALVRYLHSGANAFGVKSVQNTDLFALFCTWFVSQQGLRKQPIKKTIDLAGVSGPLSGDGGMAPGEPAIETPHKPAAPATDAAHEAPATDHAPAEPTPAAEPVAEDDAPAPTAAAEAETPVAIEPDAEIPATPADLTVDSPQDDEEELETDAYASSTLSESDAEALAEEARAIDMLLGGHAAESTGDTAGVDDIPEVLRILTSSGGTTGAIHTDPGHDDLDAIEQLVSEEPEAPEAPAEPAELAVDERVSETDATQVQADAPDPIAAADIERPAEPEASATDDEVDIAPETEASVAEAVEDRHESEETVAHTDESAQAESDETVMANVDDVPVDTGYDAEGLPEDLAFIDELLRGRSMTDTRDDAPAPEFAGVPDFEYEADRDTAPDQDHPEDTELAAEPVTVDAAEADGEPAVDEPVADMPASEETVAEEPAIDAEFEEEEPEQETPIYLPHHYMPDVEDEPVVLEAGIELVEDETLDRDPLEVCAELTGFDMDELGRWIETVRRKKQVIICGPPGAGKTFLARHLARYLAESGDGFVETLQFHPGYSYDDFIGLRYDLAREQDRPAMGHFTLFCEKAARRSGECVLVVDEINRADLNRVLGELVYLLEYRGESLSLAAGRTLRVPPNAYMIGTMSAIAGSAIDPIIRRRFAFIYLPPRYDILQRYLENTGYDAEPLIGVLEQLNDQIEDPNKKLGIAYFMRDNLADQLQDIWLLEVEPWLEACFSHQPEKLDAYRWKQVRARLSGS
ncbi:MAG: AAA family ATPase [Rhodothermales bacterium]